MNILRIRWLCLCIVFCFSTLALRALSELPIPDDIPVYPKLQEIDWMIADGDFAIAIDELRALYETGTVGIPRFEISWRLAQALIFSAEDIIHQDGSRDEAARRYDEAEIWVYRTIELNPDDHIGHFWNAALIGQRGMLEGALSSLRAAGDMRDNLRKAAGFDPYAGHIYYAASILYQAVPRFLSFGDRDAAVNFARAGIELQEYMYEQGAVVQVKQDVYLQLARALWDRNWSQRRRDREQFAKSSSINELEHPFDRAMQYEARLQLRPLSDREEAREILRQLDFRLSRSNLNYSDQRDLEELQKLKADWN